MKIRLFVSIELSEEVREEISRFLKRLGKSHFPVRWVRLENLHLTLAFLGWQNERFKVQGSRFKVETGELILSCLKKAVAKIEPFEIKIRGIGVFPDQLRPRVIWLGLAGDLESLAKLQKKITEELKMVGFEIEKRKFIPHLTLGRVKKGTRAPACRNLGRQIGKMQVGEFRRKILVDEVSLMESKLSKEGPIYKKLATVKLGK